MESIEDIPAFSMWKMFNEIIPVVLNMESSESNLKRFTNVLQMPEFSEMFLYNTNGLLSVHQYEDMNRKYKAFTVWLLGRFFYLLSQDKLSTIHDLLITSQKRILHKIEITQGHIYHELTLEYAGILQQLNDYCSNGFKDQIKLEAFIPDRFNDLKDNLDLSPLFIEIDSQKSWYHILEVTLKFIKPILINKLELYYVKDEVVSILNNLLIILKKNCMKLKLMVLDIFSNIVGIKDDFPIRIHEILKEILSIYEILLHKMFVNTTILNMEFEEITINILKNMENTYPAKQKSFCEFILYKRKEFNLKISDALIKVCLKFVGDKITFEDFDLVKIYHKQIIREIKEMNVSKTWNKIYNELLRRLNCSNGCDFNNNLLQLQILFEMGVNIKIALNMENFVFIEEVEFFPKLLTFAIQHNEFCGLEFQFDIFCNVFVNFVFISKCKNENIYFNIIGFPFIKANDFHCPFIGFPNQNDIKFKIKAFCNTLKTMDLVNNEMVYRSLCYFMSFAEDRSFEEKFMNEVSINDVIVPYLSPILSKTVNVDLFLDKILMPLLLTQDIPLQVAITKELPQVILLLCSNYTVKKIFDEDKHKFRFKFESDNSLNANIRKSKKLDSQKILNLVKALFNFLKSEDTQVKINVIGTLPFLAQYLPMFHKIQLLKWMHLIVDADEEVRNAFAKTSYEIIKGIGENVDIPQAQKTEMFENIFVLLTKAVKKSLQYNFEQQETILLTIEMLSQYKNEMIQLEVLKLVLYYIMMASSKHPFVAINIFNEIPRIYSSSVSKIYAKYRRELCEIIIQMCVVNLAIVKFNLSKSLERISLVLGFFCTKDFIVEETRYFLPFLVAFVVEMPQVEQLIEQVAYFNELEVSELIAGKFGYIFLHIFLNDTDDVSKKCMGYIEKTTKMNGTNLRKRNFMIILNELLLNFHNKRERVLLALNHLAKEDSSRTQNSIPDFLQPRFLGILQYFDLKLISQNFNKQRVLLSLAQIFKYMGPKYISPLRFKIIAMLRTALSLNHGSFPELNSDVWDAFISSCDIEVLGPQLATIFVSILPLVITNEERINKIFRYLIVTNENFVKDNIPDLFFVLDFEIDCTVLEIIRKYLEPIQERHFKEHLNYFMKYLCYETIDVRIYALKYIRGLLQNNREELDQMILGYNGIDKTIVELLDILTLGCREHDNALKLACSECISELGAIEPSHIPRRYTQNENSFNFFITEDGFILNTLNELVKALQAEKNTQNMDRFSLAIQEILKYYGISPDPSSPKHSLWILFQESHQALMLPLLSSKYTMAQSLENIKVSPVYGSKYGSSFQSWIYNWTISLISAVKSSKKNILQVCLPSMKQDLKILMHFLPHILLHALIESDQINQLAFDEFMALLESRKQVPASTQLLKVRPIRTEVCLSYDKVIKEDGLQAEEYTKVAFILLDFLDRWIREWLWDKGAIERENESYKRVNDFLSRFCKLKLAKCNYECGEYTRALMYLEEYMISKNEIANNELLSLLAEIYYQLDEPDGVAGVTALRQGEPSLDQRILSFEVSGKLSDAAACYERMSLPLHLPHILGLMRCYLHLDNVNTALNFAQGALERQPEYTNWLLEAQAEPLWRLGRYDELNELLKKPELQGNDSWSVQIGHSLLHIKNNSREAFKQTLSSLRMAQVNFLGAASLEEGAYQHGYLYITRLHALNELEKLENVIHELLLRPNDQNVVINVLNRLKIEWNLRIKVVQQSIKVTEPLLCLRRVGIEQAKKMLQQKVPKAVPILDEILGESWLRSAEIARADDLHQQAYTFLLKAEEYGPPKLFLEKAKLHWMRDEHEQALTTLKRGLEKYFPDGIPRCTPSANLSIEQKKICAEAKLLIAYYNDSISNVDTDVNIQHYKEAMDMFREWEKSLVNLAQYYDRVFQNFSNEEKDVKGSDMQIHMINYFGKSLQYGTNYVYQSMPRMLSIWFDYGTRLLDVTVSKIKEERKGNLLKMTKLIDTFLSRLPAYIFLTAFSQIVSRICHPQKEVYKELIEIIIKLIQSYPQQSLWMMIPVIKSSYSLRSKRCTEILNDSRLKTFTLGKFITDFTKFADKLIELCNKPINDCLQKLSINSLLRTLPKLITREDFSQIMIPTQMFRKLILPNPDFINTQHNPFPNHYVHVVGIEDEMTILMSLQKPRKITLKGSDGKGYVQMLKPKDDLRKDFRLMEFNDIVNQLLSREPESRQRRLNIRLYSVAPLNEECGLIEWVHDLVGLRPTLMTLYKQRGLGMKGRELKEAMCKQSDTLNTKRDVFLKVLIPKHPPVLGEWFRKTFPDAQAWLTARTAYIRTTAVISMVGHILGLGDRHGENILLDSKSGDTVHVDFNCLFNKGEILEWPERVPFRLTHNMVNAMGPLGVEGLFRISCACTLRVLRTHRNTLMSIVTPFVYDPLVSWPKNSSSSNAQNLERTNELALDRIREIECRLQGQVKTKSRSYSIPLSVEGQTNHLILEAKNIDNLCQMYFGWGPYL